jgi:hypothetical protein
MTTSPPIIDELPAGAVEPAQDPAVAWTAAWFGFFVTLLVLVTPAVFIFSTPLQPRSSNAWWAALFVTVIGGLRFSWVAALGEVRLFELIFWLFTYCFLGLAPMVQLRSQQFPGTTPDVDPRYYLPAMAVVLVGIAAFAVGLLLPRRVDGYDRMRLLPPGRRPTKPRRVAVRPVTTAGTVVLSAFSVLVTGYYVSRLGVGVLFTTRAQRGVAEASLGLGTANLAVFRAVATLPLLVSVTALMRLRAQRRASGGTVPLPLPLGILVLLVLVDNPLVAPRYVAGTALLSVFVAFGAAATPRRVRWFALLLAAGLVLVFPYADITRTSDDVSLAEQPGVVQALASSDFDAYSQIANTLDYVHVHGHTHGAQLLGAALFAVPRVAWPDKPVDTGILLAEYRNYAVTNLSAPIWSEFYIDGGWLLLVVGMAVLGLALRRLDDQAVRTLTRGARHPGGVLVTVLPFYLVLMLRGSLLQSMAGATVLVVSAFVVSGRLERDRSRPATPGPLP